MIHNFINGRIYVFIDAENIFYSQKTLGWKIAYQKLIKYLRIECGKDSKYFFYSGVDENNTKQKKFLDMLDINGYILRTKSVKKIKTSEGYQWKGNLDIELALEMIELKDSFDSAILMSGDSDFAVVVEKLKTAGKKVLVISTRGHISRELLERAPYLDIRKLKEKISQ